MFLIKNDLKQWQSGIYKHLTLLLLLLGVVVTAAFTMFAKRVKFLYGFASFS